MNTRSLATTRNERGVTTMEYAVCTGAGVGLGSILWKLLTSSFGQEFVKSIFDSVRHLLPF
jgi:hypothetical protein